MNYTIYAPGSSIPWVWAFNAVASLCANSAFISFVWGSAVAASLLGFTKAILSGVTQSAEETNRRIGNAAISMVIAGIIALSLTGSANWNLQIEDMPTGSVTKVDHVPMATSFLQWSATNIFTNGFSTMLETVTQDTGQSSAALSVGGYGFLNPVNSLLSARGIISNGLSAPNSAGSGTGTMDASIAGQLNEIVAYCLVSPPSSFASDVVNPQPSTPYVQLANENSATAVGVMLGYAAQSSATVPLFDGNPDDVIPCPAAVSQFSANVQSGLSNTQFAALANNPNTKADTTTSQNDYGRLMTIQQAFGAMVASGQRDASKEVLNMLFYNVVDQNLNCINATGTSKTSCLVSAEQAKVNQQAALDNAANAYQLTTYAASFPNFLGPITVVLTIPLLIMCMFSGMQGVSKAITSLSHVILWPIVIYSIGAPVINGLMSNYIGRQLDWITSSGAMNHPQVALWYSTLSQSVSAMSTIQASIGTFIAIIFGFGAAAGIVAVSQAMAGKDRFNEKLFSPEINNAPSLTSSDNYLGNVKQAGGQSLFVPNGQAPMTSGSVQAGAMAATKSNQVQEQIKFENLRKDVMSDAESWHKADQYSHTTGTANKSTVRTGASDSTTDRDSAGTKTHIGLSGGNKSSTGTRAIAKLLAELGGGVDLNGKNEAPPREPVNPRTHKLFERTGKSSNSSASGGGSGGGSTGNTTAAGELTARAKAAAGGEVSAYAQNDYQVGQDWSKMSESDRIKSYQEGLQHDYQKEVDQHGNTEKAKSFQHKLDQVKSYTEEASRRDSRTQSSSSSDENKNAATAFSARMDEGTVLNAINEPGNELRGYTLGQGQQYLASAQKADPVKFAAIENDWQRTFGNSATMKELKSQDYAAYQALHQNFVAGRSAGDEGLMGLLSQKQIFDSYARMSHAPGVNFSNNLPKVEAKVHDIPVDREFLAKMEFGGEVAIPSGHYVASPDLMLKDNGAMKMVDGKITSAEKKAKGDHQQITKDSDTNENALVGQLDFAQKLGLSPTNDNSVLPTAINTGLQSTLQGTAQAGLALNKAIGTLSDDATVPTPMTAPGVYKKDRDDGQKK